MRNRTKTVKFRHPNVGMTSAKISECAYTIVVETFGGEESFHLISSATQSGKIAGLFARATVDNAKIAHEHHVENLCNHGDTALVNRFCKFVNCAPLADAIRPTLIEWMQTS